MNDYFSNILNLLTDIDNERKAKNLVDNPKSVEDLITKIMKLVKQEEIYNNSYNPQEYDSGREFLAKKAEFIDKFGKYPDKELLSLAFKESIFDKIELNNLTLLQERIINLAAEADKDNNLLVRRMGERFIRTIQNNSLNTSHIGLKEGHPIDVLLNHLLMKDKKSMSSFITETKHHKDNITDISERPKSRYSDCLKETTAFRKLDALVEDIHSSKNEYLQALCEVRDELKEEAKNLGD